MTTTCTCGYEAAGPDDLADHLAAAFVPADDRAPDGQIHAEAALDDPGAAPACLCGFTAGSLAALDEHLLAAFTLPGGTGVDGARHAAAG